MNHNLILRLVTHPIVTVIALLVLLLSTFLYEPELNWVVVLAVLYLGIPRIWLVLSFGHPVCLMHVWWLFVLSDEKDRHKLLFYQESICILLTGLFVGFAHQNLAISATCLLLTVLVAAHLAMVVETVRDMNRQPKVYVDLLAEAGLLKDDEDA
jgi:hypothetical protein